MSIICIIGEVPFEHELTQLLLARRHIVLLIPDAEAQGAYPTSIVAALAIHASNFKEPQLSWAAKNVGMFAPEAVELWRRDHLDKFAQLWVSSTVSFEWCMECGLDQVRYLGPTTMARAADYLTELGL